jgi:phosphatidylserine decarboxylase
MWVYVLAAVVAAWMIGVVFLRRVWFYRDPPRSPERTGDVIVAPADGRVVYIRRIDNGGIYAEKLGRRIDLPEIAGCECSQVEGWAIGIYMSPLDVHFNYCPRPGKVEKIHRVSARVNLPMLDAWEYIRMVWLRRMVDMFARRYHLENERNTIFLDCDRFRIAVVLIADKFVNKIKCFVEPGQKLGFAQKLGFIERGSQVDLLILDNDIEFEVGINQQVYGGKTVIARFGNRPAVSADAERSLGEVAE